MSFSVTGEVLTTQSGGDEKQFEDTGVRLGERFDTGGQAVIDGIATVISDVPATDSAVDRRLTVGRGGREQPHRWRESAYHRRGFRLCN
jgi:hypothetical protein